MEGDSEHEWVDCWGSGMAFY